MPPDGAADWDNSNAQRKQYAALSECDDVLTDVLIDSLFLDFKTHKMAADYAERASLAQKDPHAAPNRKEIASAVVKLIQDAAAKRLSLDQATDRLVAFFRAAAEAPAESAQQPAARPSEQKSPSETPCDPAESVQPPAQSAAEPSLSSTRCAADDFADKPLVCTNKLPETVADASKSGVVSALARLLSPQHADSLATAFSDNPMVPGSPQPEHIVIPDITNLAITSKPPSAADPAATLSNTPQPDEPDPAALDIDAARILQNLCASGMSMNPDVKPVHISTNNDGTSKTEEEEEEIEIESHQVYPNTHDASMNGKPVFSQTQLEPLSAPPISVYMTHPAPFSALAPTLKSGEPGSSETPISFDPQFSKTTNGCIDPIQTHVELLDDTTNNEDTPKETKSVAMDPVEPVLDEDSMAEDDEYVVSDHIVRAFLYYAFVLRGKSERDITDFRDHARRYLAIYMSKAGFEIDLTDRYANSKKVEARILATKDWMPGDEIRFCSGIFADLTLADERKLAQRDFSVMYSTKRKCYGLFLGPARFANHDCRSNCKFVPFGKDSISICFKVTRPIRAGQEITVYYGDNYFGEGNKECLCESCEKYEMGGFQKDVSQARAEDDASNYAVSKGLGLRRNAARPKNFSYYHNYDGFDFDSMQKRKKTDHHGSHMPTCSVCMQHLNVFALRRLKEGDPESIYPFGEQNDALETIQNILSMRFDDDRLIEDAQNVVSEANVDLNTQKPSDGALVKSSRRQQIAATLRRHKMKVVCARCMRHRLIFGSDWPCRLPGRLIQASPSRSESSEMTVSEMGRFKLSPVHRVGRLNAQMRRAAVLVQFESSGSDLTEIDSDADLLDDAQMVSYIKCSRNRRLRRSKKPKNSVVCETQSDNDVPKNGGMRGRLMRIGGRFARRIVETDESSPDVRMRRSRRPCVSDAENSPVAVRSQFKFSLPKNVSLFKTSRKRRPSVTKKADGGNDGDDECDSGEKRVCSEPVLYTDPVPGNPVESDDQMILVFVDPKDPREPFWWPAVLVPRMEIDVTMIRGSLKPDMMMVTYLEAPKYFTPTHKNDLRLFDPHADPYLMFMERPGFSDCIARKLCLEFLKKHEIVYENQWHKYGLSRRNQTPGTASIPTADPDLPSADRSADSVPMDVDPPAQNEPENDARRSLRRASRDIKVKYT